MTTSDARERVLATASALFYERGINQVGIDLVIATSGVAKMTLYRHFPSKEALVLAFLDRINAQWLTWLRARVSSPAIPAADRPLALFDALGAWFETPTFRGCPFVSTAAEFRDPVHPAHQAAWRFKAELRDYLRELVRDAGYVDVESLADQLLLLADGATVRAAMEGRPDSATSARNVAAALLRVS